MHDSTKRPEAGGPVLTRRGFVGAVAGCGLAAGALGSLAGCGGQGSGATDHVIRFGYVNPKMSLDPQIATDGAEGIDVAICDTLLAFDENNDIQPLLVTGLPETDGITYSFELKEGVKFHDGSTLTSDDVKFTFERMFTPETNATSTNGYDHIVGAKDMLAGNATELAGFEVVDDRHFTITLDTVWTLFEAMLCERYAVIYPRKACTEAGSDWGSGTNLIGTGPFKLTANDDATGLTLERFDDYHGGAAKLERIELSWIDDVNTLVMSFKNGDIDLCNLDATLYQQYSQDEATRDFIVPYTPPRVRFVTLNLKDPLFQDVRVREAMSLAINRQELVDTVLAGAATAPSQFVTPGEVGYDENGQVLPYDPDRARELVEQAGAAGAKVTLATQEANKNVAVAIQGYWNAIGLDVSVNQMDNGMFADDRKAGNLQAAVNTWMTLCWVGAEHMRSFYHSTKSVDYSSFYASQEFDDAVDDAEETLDESEQFELIVRGDQLLTQTDYAAIPTDWPSNPSLQRPGITGLYRNPRYSFNNQVDFVVQG